MSIRSKNRTRKQRMIKNAIVNVDNVNIECGANNINWLKIAKQKLIQRELKLLHKRQTIVDRIVKDVIHSFVDQNMNQYNFNRCLVIYEEEIRHKLMNGESSIMMRCAQDIAATLKKWRGYKPDEESSSFRAYFQRCRHWFDTKKITIMTIDFWIPIMQLIHEFAVISGEYFFSHQSRGLYQSYTDYLNVLILKSLFEGQMKPSNARNMWLVPAMSYAKILRKYNQNLQITLRESPKQNKAFRKQYLQCFNNKYDDLREAFDGEMYEYCALNAPHSSLRDNYNVHNHHYNQLDLNVASGLEPFAPRFNSSQLSFSNHTNHIVNHDANAFGYNDALCSQMNQAQSQRLPPQISAVSGKRYTTEFSNYNINDINTNTNEMLLPHISSSPPSTMQQFHDLSHLSFSPRFNSSQLPFISNHTNHNMNHDAQCLEMNQAQNPFVPLPSFIPPHYETESRSSNWYENEVVIPHSCQCKCHQACCATTLCDVDCFPFDTNQYPHMSYNK